ncbi:MAG TPA: hypothetical protein ENJ17_01140 [Gammaproteobacteria bacterium]|nr:hypothetical protein [Gammaproteobacteria bacterium]
MDKRDEALANEYGVDIDSNDVDALLDSIAEKANRSARLIIEVGLQLMAVKRTCGHGDFEPLLESRGLNTQRASEFMRYAKFAASLSKAERDKVLGQPKKKVLALASADPEVLREVMADDEKFGNVTALSPTEMLKQLKKLRSDLEKADMREEKIRQQALEVRAAPSFQYPPSIDRIRVESSVLAKQATLHLDDIEQLMTELASAPDLSADKMKAQAEYSAGATTLFVNLQAIHAKAAYLMQWFRESIGEDYMPTQPQDAPTLTDDEAVRALAMRDLLLAEDHAAKLSREMGSVKKKRGRPRKAK